MAFIQDTERGRQSSINTLLAEVSERSYPKLSREETERLRQEVSLIPSPASLCQTPVAAAPVKHSFTLAPVISQSAAFTALLEMVQMLDSSRQSVAICML